MNEEIEDPIPHGDDKESILSYYDLTSALNDVKKDFDFGDTSDKAKSSAKLLGKTIFNVGLFAGKIGLEGIKAAPGILENKKNELEVRNNEIRELRLEYEEISNKELIRFLHSKGIFGKSSMQKGVALSVLKDRGLTAEDLKPEEI